MLVFLLLTHSSTGSNDTLRCLFVLDIFTSVPLVSTLLIQYDQSSEGLRTIGERRWVDLLRDDVSLLNRHTLIPGGET